MHTSPAHWFDADPTALNTICDLDLCLQGLHVALQRRLDEHQISVAMYLFVRTECHLYLIMCLQVCTDAVMYPGTHTVSRA